MALKCNACGRFLSAPEAVACPGCLHTNHRECVHVPAGVLVGESWRCPECRDKMPRKASTPVQQGALDNSMVEAMDNAALDITTPLDVTAYMDTSAPDAQGSVLRELRLLRDEIREARQEFQALRSDVMEVKTLVSQYNGRVDAVEARMNALEKRVEEREAEPAHCIQALEDTVARLRLDLMDREQEALGNDVDISGIPETSGENVVHVVLGCAVKVGLRLDERDLVSCQRVGSIREDGGGAARPRPIAVRLARRSLRDELLKAARVRRTPTTEGVGIVSTPARFYINERLTRENRRLFYAVRESARNLQWRYVWTRDGKIYTRMANGDPGHRIRNELDLRRVFGPEYVRIPTDRKA